MIFRVEILRNILNKSLPFCGRESTECEEDDDESEEDNSERKERALRIQVKRALMSEDG